MEKLKEEKLPPIDAFASRLKDENIPEEDYKHAVEVYKKFGFKKLEKFVKLYVGLDTTLLCDVFEAFRKICHKEFHLDACNFVSGASLSWKAALKMTGVELELITDRDMYDLINNGIRGGYAGAGFPIAQANNKEMKSKTFDASSPSTWLYLFDIINQYGNSMRKPLPVSDFKFIKDISQFTKKYIENIPPMGERGFFFEVTLRYPAKLHDAHNCFPLAPEHIRISEHDLSKQQKEMYTSLYGTSKIKLCKKLVTTLNDKKKYVVHFRALQTYLKYGLEIEEVHRVIEFKQEAFLKVYIEHLTELRKLSRDAFEKSIWKLMINSIYGMCIFIILLSINILFL